jgi:hypothetical protein
MAKKKNSALAASNASPARESNPETEPEQKTADSDEKKEETGDSEVDPTVEDKKDEEADPNFSEKLKQFVEDSKIEVHDDPPEVDPTVEDKKDEEADPNFNEKLKQFVEDSKVEVYDDPPLEEMESEVSVASGFDMRSIHDYPPAPPSPPTVPEDKEFDPSWDASEVVFDAEKKADTQKDDGIDVFETDSWARTDASFTAMPNAYADIDEFAQKLMEDQEQEQTT